MIREKPRVHIIVGIHEKPKVTLVDNDFAVGVINAFIPPSTLPAGAARLEVHLVAGNAQSLGHGPTHDGQPFGHRLLAGVFTNHQMTVVPVHHGTNLGNIPVVKPEHLDIPAGKAFAEVFESFADPVGQHRCLPIEFMLRC